MSRKYFFQNRDSFVFECCLVNMNECFYIPRNLRMYKGLTVKAIYLNVIPIYTYLSRIFHSLNGKPYARLKPNSCTSCR